MTAITRTADALLVPTSVAPQGESVLEHILFALKHEGTNLAVLRLAMPTLAPESLSHALAITPNSGYLRITAYLFEAFTGQLLQDIPALRGSFTHLFDPDLYYTGDPVKNSRWRINFNGIGSLNYCVTVRKTEALAQLLALNILEKVRAFYADARAEVLDRALSWAYLSETEGTFALENESPRDDKAAIFVKLLQQAHEPRPMTEGYLVELQNSTVTNPLDHATQYRIEQNWLRKRGLRGPAGVSYIPPKPDDIDDLMQKLLSLLNEKPAAIDPIMLAAIISFGFVFIHPFMDGNGRLSRFLFHYTLCQSGALPKGLMLPVSIALKRSEDRYLEALRRVVSFGFFLGDLTLSWQKENGSLGTMRFAPRKAPAR